MDIRNDNNLKLSEFWSSLLILTTFAPILLFDASSPLAQCIKDLKRPGKLLFGAIKLSAICFFLMQ